MSNSDPNSGPALVAQALTAEQRMRLAEIRAVVADFPEPAELDSADSAVVELLAMIDALEAAWPARPQPELTEGPTVARASAPPEAAK